MSPSRNFISLLLVALTIPSFAAEAAALKQYSISDITVSGLSAGAYMAVQMHVAFSSLVNGSAIFAGGPFYCAEGNLMYAEYKCMQTYQGLPNVDQLVSLTKTDEKTGDIDKTANLADDKVYLFSGSADTVVKSDVMHSLQEYYNFFVSPSAIVADFNVKAEHCWPTLSNGEACATLGSPYIGKCNFDGAASALKTLYGQNLNARGSYVAGNLQAFSQSPYLPAKAASLADTGYIYVPTACASGTTTCHLHISFHGCLQTADEIKNQYATDIGLNEWAETNNIIVLYPYVKKSLTIPSNPNGCWDWWGYTDKYYGVKSGVQMKFVRDLIKAVSGK